MYLSQRCGHLFPKYNDAAKDTRIAEKAGLESVEQIPKVVVISEQQIQTADKTMSWWPRNSLTGGNATL